MCSLCVHQPNLWSSEIVSIKQMKLLFQLVDRNRNVMSDELIILKATLGLESKCYLTEIGYNCLDASHRVFPGAYLSGEHRVWTMLTQIY